MAKVKRVARPQAELREELRSQLLLMHLACKHYDSGIEAAAKHIALSLRVLLYHHKQSKALLEQLRLLQHRYFNSSMPLNPRNLLPECNMVILRMSDAEGRYIPAVAAGGSPFPGAWVPFYDWWNQRIVKDKDGNFFTRMDLVLHVADTDGGAHVDPELEESYMNFSRNNSLGWTFGNQDFRTAFLGRPDLACIRQIAEEVFKTVKTLAPDCMPAS